MAQKCQNIFVIWAQFDFGTRASPKQPAGFLPSRSQSKASLLCWNNFVQNYSLWCRVDPAEQNCHQILLVLTCQNFQRHNSPALPVSFRHQGVN